MKTVSLSPVLRALEGAAVGGLVVLAGYVTNTMMASLPVAVATGTLVYKQGLTLTEVETLVEDVMQKIPPQPMQAVQSTGQQPAAAASKKTVAPATNAEPTFNQDGVQVTAQLNAPMGQRQVINGGTYVVGQAIQAPISVNGTTVPAGAVYVGARGFELNGNYYYI